MLASPWAVVDCSVTVSSLPMDYGLNENDGVYMHSYVMTAWGGGGGGMSTEVYRSKSVKSCCVSFTVTDFCSIS